MKKGKPLVTEISTSTKLFHDFILPNATKEGSQYMPRTQPKRIMKFRCLLHTKDRKNTKRKQISC